MRPYERWPGLEHLEKLDAKVNLSKNVVGFEFKILDDKAENMLNNLVKKIDDNSVLGEWGVRFCLVSSLILLVFGSIQASLIPIIILAGSIIRFFTEKKKSLKQPVQVTENAEEKIEQAVFGTKNKKKSSKKSKKSSKQSPAQDQPQQLEFDFDSKE